MDKQVSAFPFTWKSIIFSFILFLALDFNLYKLPLTEMIPYNIFPWSPSPQIAKTPPKALRAHLESALILFILAYLRCLHPESDVIFILFCIFHMKFSYGLIPNLQNFGNANKYTALTINGGLFVALQVALLIDPAVYYCILSIPVLFEVGLYVRETFTIWTICHI